MANTFKLTTRDVAPASSGTPEEIYDCPDNITTIVLGLTLANVHTSQVTASVTLVSTTNQSGSVQNTTAHLIKDVPIPVGSTVEVMSGNKIVLNADDRLKVDCSVTDKVSVTLSYMEIDV